MKCTISHKNLFNYAENTLSPDLKDQIDSHLLTCSECRDYLTFLKDAISVIQKDKEISPNPFLFTRIITELEGNDKRELTYAKRYIPEFVFSFVLVAGILGGIFMGSLYSGTSPAYTNDLQEEVSYINDIRQESIETFFLITDNDENE